MLFFKLLKVAWEGWPNSGLMTCIYRLFQFPEFHILAPARSDPIRLHLVKFDSGHRIRFFIWSNSMIFILSSSSTDLKRISSNGRAIDNDVELIAGWVLQSNSMTTWSNSIVLRWNRKVLELFFALVEFDQTLIEFDDSSSWGFVLRPSGRIRCFLVEFDQSLLEVIFEFYSSGRIRLAWLSNLWQAITFSSDVRFGRTTPFRNCGDEIYESNLKA